VLYFTVSPYSISLAVPPAVLLLLCVSQDCLCYPGSSSRSKRPETARWGGAGEGTKISQGDDDGRCVVLMMVVVMEPRRATLLVSHIPGDLAAFLLLSLLLVSTSHPSLLSLP
jgi:hypothetical protein